MDPTCIDLADESEIEMKGDAKRTPYVKPLGQQVIDLTDDNKKGKKPQPLLPDQTRGWRVTNRAREATRK